MMNDERPRWRAVQVHAQPPESHLQKFLGGLWAAVRAETGGRLDVTVHPLSMGIPGGGPNVLKKVLAGEIAFHVFMGPGLAQAVPAMGSRWTSCGPVRPGMTSIRSSWLVRGGRTK